MILEVIISLIIFVISYIISVTFTSVFYHRALCHRALKLNPSLEKFVLYFGYFITAIDPAIWICTHRMHHIYSDKDGDPHSPAHNPGLLQINNAHLRYYVLLNKELKNKASKYYSYIKDLNISLHPLMFLPNIPLLNISAGNAVVYSLHIMIYYLLFHLTGSILYSVALALGLLGHPLQGTLVNYFGHIQTRHGGYRNFELDDDSCNNKIVAFLIFGEGLQNNHHKYPSAVKFSIKPGEFDFGYYVCVFLKKIKLVHF